ncbi:hypothetical protein Syun_011935 [Stephania yunnanensis]|uniref:Calponin-homology (CH) domain-containing protein n=1 Tax=Stephania yunnanensis TaxID=152371 RepID=A0AAP0JZH9_9MAGN
MQAIFDAIDKRIENKSLITELNLSALPCLYDYDVQLIKILNLRFHSQGQGKEMTDADILNWANNKVKSTGRNSQMDSFKDKSLSDGVFFLELLSVVEPRVVNWSVVTKGEDDPIDPNQFNGFGLGLKGYWFALGSSNLRTDGQSKVSAVRPAPAPALVLLATLIGRELR